MSTAISIPAPAAPARDIRQPLVWLLAILALGLVLRAMHFRAGFQVEEFAAAATVADRQGVPSADAPGVAFGYTPTADDPIVAVGGLGEVSRRSVIPYGIQDPVPLYHYVLWGVAKVLPVTDWSLRLPSLLAGLGCILGVYWLCRRAFGVEMALVAALFVALDPIQIATSWLARPYALGNLTVVLSFMALAALLDTRKPAVAALLALGYAACIAVLGYLSPVMLLVVIGHVGMVVYALVKRGPGAALPAVLAAVGLVVGIAALAPEFSYWGQVYEFSSAHKDYLNEQHPLQLLTFFWHNLALIGGLLLVLAAGAIVRMQLQGGGAEEKSEGEAAAPEGGGAAPVASGSTAVTAAAPAVAPAVAEPKPELVQQPLPENEDALWMGRFWLFLPQLAAIVLMYLLDQSVYTTRFLTYTTLGAAILLAYYATRDASREVRLGVVGVVALALLAFGFWETRSLGDQTLYSCFYAKDDVGSLASDGMQKVWQDGDVVLMRSGLMESDLLRADIPEGTRPEVQRAMLAPLTLLYPDRTRKPVVALPLSEYRNDTVKTKAGEKAPLREYYDDRFVAKLKEYKRYRMTGVATADRHQPNSPAYLAGFLPRLANFLDKELLLSRNRGESGEKEHYVVIPPHLSPEEPIEGLTKGVQEKDFDSAVHLVQPQTKK